jgi:hypothetical protein
LKLQQKKKLSEYKKNEAITKKAQLIDLNQDDGKYYCNASIYDLKSAFIMAIIIGIRVSA